MNRELLIGNGNVLVGFDRSYRLREFYFPSAAGPNRIGRGGCSFVFGTGGRLVGPGDSACQVRIKYLRGTPSGSVSLACPSLELIAHCHDVVDRHLPILIRRIRIRNLADERRTIILYHHQNFAAAEEGAEICARFDEALSAAVHEMGSYRIAAGFRTGNGPAIDEYYSDRPVELKEIVEGGVVPDATGAAGRHSLIRTHLDLDEFQEGEVYLVIFAGASSAELGACGDVLAKAGPGELISRTEKFWQAWSSVRDSNFGHLPSRVADLYTRSLLILRAHVLPDGGAMVTDFSVDEDRVGHHGYGRAVSEIFAARALDAAGWGDLSRGIYQGLAHRPADLETAGGMLVWALWAHYAQYRDMEYVYGLWSQVIRELADRLAELPDPQTLLPPPGDDPWGKNEGIDLFRVCALAGGLMAAENFARGFGDAERAVRYATAAEKLQTGLDRQFYRAELGRFVRAVVIDAKDGLRVDPMVDSLSVGLTRFGIFSPNDPRVEATMTAVSERLRVRSPTGGLMRFEADDPAGETSPGVAWMVPTLWLAEYLVARARTVRELRQVLPHFEWVLSHASGAGFLYDAVTPAQDRRRVARPSVWSHAEFVLAVASYLEKLERFCFCENCGQPTYRVHGSGRPVRAGRGAEPVSTADLPLHGTFRFERKGCEVGLTIDLQECLGCGVCAMKCRERVLKIIRHKVQADQSRLARCTLCMACERACSVGAIRVVVSTSRGEEEFLMSEI